MTPAKFKVGDTVFDRASRQTAIITATTSDEVDHYYTLDDTVPLNPTKDKAFPDRGRCEHEICTPDDPTKDDDFTY